MAVDKRKVAFQLKREALTELDNIFDSVGVSMQDWDRAIESRINLEEKISALYRLVDKYGEISYEEESKEK